MGWIYVLPNMRGYRIRQGIITLESGAKTHQLLKIPVEELSAWDATHDASGRSLRDEDGLEQRSDATNTVIEKA